MWFKRRKSSEQDHALSESLRSLQNLLSETDRREPNLDPEQSPGAEADEPAGPGRAPATRAARQSGPDSRGSGPHDAEPEAPGGSANRWRDLSLSFDAEPVIPRAPRDSVAEADHTDAAPAPDSREPAEEPAEEPVTDPDTEEAAALSEPPEAPRVPADQAATGLDDTEQPVEPNAAEAVGPDLPPREPAPEPVSPSDADLPDEGSEPDDGPQAPEQDESEMITYDVGAKPVPPPPYRGDAVQDFGPPTDPDAWGGETSRAESEPPDYHAHSSPDDAVLVLDLEQAETSSAEPMNEDQDEVAGSFDAGQAAEPDGSRIVPEDTGSDEPAEDQLHLELDPDTASQADIPVLTNAVYVPEPPAKAPAPGPGPAESPHEQPIGRCIDKFRDRLQLMGLDTLSPEQEKELRDVLVEFLDQLDHD